MPKVSIVIPSYNHARFLDLRLRTVLRQTLQDFEVIVIDDASTDESSAILKRFAAADSRIRFIENAVNSGTPFKQWNRGVREAKGELIWIGESDDYADERLLATLVERLEQNPKVGLAYCQSFMVDATGRVLGDESALVKDLAPGRWKSDFVNSGHDECAKYLVFRNTIPNASAVVFRRDAFLAMGGADEGMRLCGDWMAWASILLQSDVAFVAEPLNFHRIHPAALRQTTSLEVSATEGWKVSERIVDEVDIAPADMLALKKRFANEWASVTVLQHKRTFDAGVRRFRELSQYDRLFALRSAGQVLRYALTAARKRLALPQAHLMKRRQ
jgi:glycosyltransferase involved in cell wall biosynthesis